LTRSAGTASPRYRRIHGGVLLSAYPDIGWRDDARGRCDDDAGGMNIADAASAATPTAITISPDAVDLPPTTSVSVTW